MKIQSVLPSIRFGSWRHLIHRPIFPQPATAPVGQQRCVALAFLAVLLALGPEPVANGADPASGLPGHTERLGGPDAVPAGLLASDWASIRQQFERNRHAAVPLDGGYQARNHGQHYRMKFDGRGFTAHPETGDWQWGLELRSYGLPGKECVAAGPPRVSTEGPRVAYDWDEVLQEWFVNDLRGLEHGFTIRSRAAGAGGTLHLNLVVRGGLHPEVQPDGRKVRFLNADGAPVLDYTKLEVTDADGRTLPARFEPVAGESAALRVAVEERGARYPITVDPLVQQAYLKPSDTATSGSFGYSVAISGDTVVIGAPFESSGFPFDGAAGSGVQNAPFNGLQLAQQADTSAPGSGAAYVFVRDSSGNWAIQAYLKASNTGAGDNFGWSVAISGNTVVVGAHREDSKYRGVKNTPVFTAAEQGDNSKTDSGAAYVFVRDNSGSWKQQAYLKASNTQKNYHFGVSVGVSEDTVVVGAFGESSKFSVVQNTPFGTPFNVAQMAQQNNVGASSSGAAYVFVRIGTTWKPQAFLKPFNTGALDLFGFAVAVDVNTVVVGAYGEDSNAIGVNGSNNNLAGGSGAAYVFVRSGTTWSQDAYLKASNTDLYGDRFGYSVAVSDKGVSDKTVVVGAPFERSKARGVGGDQSDNSLLYPGAAYVFVRSALGWSQQEYLKARNTDSRDLFGYSVAVAGDTVVVGAPGEQSNATGVNGDDSNNSADSSGAAYVFVRSGAAWSLPYYLKASNTDAHDEFGWSVAVSDSGSGPTVVAGAIGEASNFPAVLGDPSVQNTSSWTTEQGNNTPPSTGAAYVFRVIAGLRIAHQPQSQTVTQGQAATFSVEAVGPGTLSYQWSHNSAPITGATNTTLYIGHVGAGDVGPYSVLVTNNAGSGLASDTATLTMVLDTNRPTLVAATAVCASNMVTVIFNEFLAAATAEDPLNYQISGGVMVQSAALAADGRTVFLSTDPLSSGLSYTLSVDSLEDLAGNTIAPGSQIAFACAPSAVDLVVSTAAAPNPVAVGNNTTVTITVQNIGGAPASGVRLTSVIPPPLTFLSASSSRGLCTFADAPISTNTFGPPLQLPTGTGAGTNTRPVSVVAVDLDGDGLLDLVSANSQAPGGSAGFISVFRNLSVPGVINSNSFAPPMQISARTALDVVAADFDNDGLIDLALCNITTNGPVVTLLRNISTGPGDIRFEPPVDLVSTGGGYALAVGDFNLDGQPDLVVVNEYRSSIYVFENRSTGSGLTTNSFGPPIELPVGPRPRCLAVGDLDGDGWPEIAVGQDGTNALAVLVNLQPTALDTNSFAPADMRPTATPISGVVIFQSDVDGNGIGAGQLVVSPDNVSAVAAADLNGDRQADVAELNEMTGRVTLFENTSVGGSFNLTEVPGSVPLTSNTPTALRLVLADLDRNGQPDLIGVATPGDALVILPNTTHHEFTCELDSLAPGEIATVTLTLGVLNPATAYLTNTASSAQSDLNPSNNVTVTPITVEPPFITLSHPSNIVVQATSPAGAVVTFDVSATSRNCAGSVVVQCTPASGSLFPVGSTVVNCVAYDVCGSTNASSFTVDVVSPIHLSIQLSGANVILSWPDGTLLEADQVTGPWSPNQATSPYTIPLAATNKFYKVVVQ